MANEKFTFEFNAKDGVTGTIKKIVKEAQNAQGSVGGIASSITALSTGFLAVKGVADLVFTGFNKVAQAFEASIDAAIEQENALNKLSSAMKIAGTFAQENLKDFENFAGELQVLTGVGDDVALKMLAMAKNFGATDKQAKDIVKTAVDLSAALDQDLGTTVEQLSGTLNGSIGRFGKLNGSLKELTPEALASGEAIKILGEQFKGQGQDQLNTYSGALGAMKGAFGDVLESIGMFIIKNETIVASLNAMTKVFLSTAGAISNFQKALQGPNQKYEDERKAIEEGVASQQKAELQKTMITRTQTEIRTGITEDQRIAETLREEEENKKRLEQKKAIFKKESEEREKAFKEQFQKSKEWNEKQAQDGIRLAKKRREEEYKNSFEGIISDRNNQISAASSALSALQTGNVGSLVSGIGNMFGPMGGLVSGITNFLAQDKNAIKDQIKVFAQAVPQFIEGLVENVPVVIEALVENAPKMIMKLVEMAPRLIVALAQNIGPVAITFANELIRSVPYIVNSMISGLWDGIKSIFDNLNPFSSDGFVGNIFSGIGDFFGFAEGGMVPKGFPNDTFPARLSSDELVIDRSLTGRLESFLDNQPESNSGNNEILLKRVINLLEQPMQVTSKVDFRQETLANVILNLSRTNARLAI